MGIELIEFKKTPQGNLNLHYFEANKEQSTGAAVVFFICGGWNGFYAPKFYPQGKYLSSRGLHVFVTEVRTISEHGTTPGECVIDAKSAIRWVRSNAEKFNIDSEKIIAAGGSASGHVSACTNIINGYEEEGEDLSISSKSNYLCLFNPALIADFKEKRINRLGEHVETLNPYKHVTSALAPTIIMQGDEDEVTTLEEAQMFYDKAKEIGVVDIQLNIYDKEGHGFFNWFDGKNKRFYETLYDMDKFLGKYDLVRGEPTIDESFEWNGPDDFGTA